MHDETQCSMNDEMPTGDAGIDCIGCIERSVNGAAYLLGAAYSVARDFSDDTELELSKQDLVTLVGNIMATAATLFNAGKLDSLTDIIESAGE